MQALQDLHSAAEKGSGKIDAHPFAGSIDGNGCSKTMLRSPRRNCIPRHFQKDMAIPTDDGFYWLDQRRSRFAAELNDRSPGPLPLASCPFGIGSTARLYRSPRRTSPGNSSPSPTNVSLTPADLRAMKGARRCPPRVASDRSRGCLAALTVEGRGERHDPAGG